MKKRITISNTGIKLPLTRTLIAYLCLDKWNAPEWLWGVIGVLYLLIWIIAIIDFWNKEQIDLFEGRDIEEVKKYFKKDANKT